VPINALSKNNDEYFERSSLDAMLSAAHSQVESRFLDGGAVLLSIMDVINKLIGSLDRLTNTLDEKTTSETVGGIMNTAAQLGGLPALEGRRQKNFATLAEATGNMHSHVADMQETMRYLRTFAITVKITGAGIAEFSGFAEEILERIHSGTAEVNKFAAQLKTLDAQLQRARGFAATIVAEYGETVPRIVADLNTDAGKIALHHKRLASLAQDVSKLARGVQTKIATVLSALQVGDITRQRIEHVQSSFQLFEELVENDADLNHDAKERLKNVLYHMNAAQLTEMVTDFQRESRNVVKNMSSFVDDTRQILTLRDAMTRESEGGAENNFLKALENSVEAACSLVGRVKDASHEADEVAASTTGTAQDLLAGIAVIRAIKTDIHYMALNTNLRCSRLGEEGKPINVVTGELRVFASKLEGSADTVVAQLNTLEGASRTLSADDKGGADTIDRPLAQALSTIRDAGNTMEENLAELAREGQEVFNQVSLSIRKLDFESELGDVLTQCASELAAMAGSDIADISDLEDKAAELGQKIYRTYTMVQERNVHQAFLPATAGSATVEAVAAPAASSGDEDEDLFADALF